MDNIHIGIVKEADAAQVLELYRLAGWWEMDDDPKHEQKVAEIIANTWRFVIVKSDDKIVGMGRAISDGVSDAYIQDVTVHPAWRGKGLGKAIIRTLVERLKQDGLGWIGLISEPGYERFYQSLGFGVMQSYTPFLLKREDS
ncbi:MAG TPA: GNAT family N-acetyltransferase [Candidatus Cloacimonadota bacterium]|nr:GNAT family N-acetyltransferase [Candidatus Cloacimonadota bacterium]